MDSRQSLITKEFKKISNPHLKSKPKATIKTQDMHRIKKVQDNYRIKIEEENEERELSSKKKSVVEDKFADAKDLLANGFVDSYIDYFYLATRKTPDIKSKYEKEHELELNSKKVLGYNYELKNLKVFCEALRGAEENLRSGTPSNINAAIEKYNEVRFKCFYLSDSLNSIYFNQKCINLSKRHNLIKQLIKSLINMGNCFDNTGNSEDAVLSMSFKEEAKKLFKHLNQKDQEPSLEISIYESLINLYKELSNQQENQKNFEKAIEYLNKQLDNLKNMSNINKDKENQSIERDQIEIYLKIAELNFKLKLYDATLDCLELLKPILYNSENSSYNIYKLKGLFLYAETYEAQNLISKAIEHLNLIEQIDISELGQEESIYAKSLLHLGRLHYQKGGLQLAKTNLNKFFKESKKIDNKELLDLARVNLGMIIGTQSEPSYVNLIKNSNYSEFLKQKLKYFVEN